MTFQTNQPDNVAALGADRFDFENRVNFNRQKSSRYPRIRVKKKNNNFCLALYVVDRIVRCKSYNFV